MSRKQNLYDEMAVYFTAVKDMAQPIDLPNMPLDIVFHMFGLLDRTTSVCLGLTCKDFYALHVHNFRYPVPLVFDPKKVVGDRDEPSDFNYAESDEKPLHERLTNWIGTQYRYSHLIGRFLKKEVYGESLSSSEGELLQREWDYLLSDYRLPNPLNMGREWYVLARACIQEDFERCEDKEEWWRFWSRLMVFFQKSWYERVMGVDFGLLAQERFVMGLRF